VDWGSDRAKAQLASCHRCHWRLALMRGSARSRHRRRCAACARIGVFGCHAFRSAIRRVRTAAAWCCRPTDAPTQCVRLVWVLRGPRRGGSGSSDPAPPDQDRGASGLSRSGPRSDGVPDEIPPAASVRFGLPGPNSAADHRVSCGAQPVKPQSPRQRTRP
jgi:hypothetical protein